MLHKNLWKAGLAVLMLMLLPLGSKADTYVSTITGVEEVQSLETQGHYYLLSTTEKNDWTLNSAAEYSDGVAIIEAPQSATLNTNFWVYGSIQYIDIEGTCAEGSTFMLKDANDQQGGYISEAIETYIDIDHSKIRLYINEANDVSDPRQLSLVYTGNSLEISKITIVTSRISIYNNEDRIAFPIYYDEDNQWMAYDNMIQFNPVDTILVINDLDLYGGQGPVIFTSYPHLTIQFLGNVTLCSTTKFITVNSPEITQKLTFATDANNPGTLTFKNEYTEYTDGNDQVITGDVTETMMSFAAPGSNYGVVVEYLDDLVQKATSETPICYIISTDNVITPIINEEDPDRDIVIINIDGTNYDNLYGKVISNVYYTLKPNEGHYDNTGGTNGVVVEVGMSDAEVEAAIKAGKPGTPEFDAKFRGITMMVPAGIGTVTIKAKGSAEGAVLKTKLGAAAAVAHNLTTDYADYVVEYQCTEPTYLYIYVLDQEPAPARPGGPNREKVQSTSVKITGYKGNSAAVVNSVGGVQTASVYSVSCTGYKAGDDHVTMSTVEVAPAAVAAARPVGGPMLTPATVSYPISSLSESVFAEIDDTDKAKLLYIDLTGTQVKDIYVDRSSGIFNGISSATTIYLPDGNNSAKDGEPNVIINGECKDLTLYESKTFKAPAGKTFKVNKVTLTRKNAFVAGKPATVFLPFTIPADQASTLGTFHTFKEISGDDAVFNTAESGDIAANTPYIFVPKNDGADITATNVTLNTTVPVASGELIGTYELIDWTTDPADIYGFSAKDQNGLTQGQFFKVKAPSSILPFRAYLKVTAAPSRLRLVIGDDTTGITTISNPENEDNIWYSLDGQRHQGKPAKQGVYIHNNQKVLVK